MSDLTPPASAVVDLLGMLAYGELVAFDRMAADARLAPDLRRRAVLTGPDRDLIVEVLHDSRHADFAADELRAAIAADPKIANRLSMWSRRLVGEGISQALRVAAERPSLAELLAVGGTDFQAMLKRLTSAHTARMGVVGLNN